VPQKLGVCKAGVFEGVGQDGELDSAAPFAEITEMRMVRAIALLAPLALYACSH
jgi:hypothetical protein